MSKHKLTVNNVLSDIDFDVYYDISIEDEEVEIGGIYLLGSNQDLIDVIDSEVIEDLEQEVLENHCE